MLKMYKMYKFPGKVGPILGGGQLQPASLTCPIFKQFFNQKCFKIGEMLKMHKFEKLQL